MKLQLFHIGSTLAVVCALTASQIQPVQGTTIAIDFDGIPAGTPLAPNNPYAGVVNLQAQSGYSYGLPALTPDGYPDGGQAWTETGVITGGWPSYSGNIAFVGPARGSILPTGAWANTSMIQLTAAFLQPVTELSFTMYVGSWYLYNGFGFQGVDQHGVPFSGGGTFGYAPDWVKTVLDAPAGGYLTELNLWDSERTHMQDDGTPAPGSMLALRSMTLDIPNCVPEPSSLGDKALLLFVAAIAPVVRRKRS
jgi:hypothetical protein